MRLDLGPWVWLDPPPHLDHEDPDTQVAVGDDADRQDEVHHHHRDSIQWAHRLGKSAGVHPRVVLQWLHEPVWHYGEDGECPDEHDIAHGVAVGEQFVIFEAVADVAVTVDGDARYVEDGANDAEAHEEPTDLTVDVAGDPAIVEDGSQDQRVGIDGDYQVSESQAHHKGVSCRWQTDSQILTEHTTRGELTPVIQHGFNPNTQPIFRFIVKWWNLVALVIITVAKEEVRWGSKKSYTAHTGRRFEWLDGSTSHKIFIQETAVHVSRETRSH